LWFVASFLVGWAEKLMRRKIGVREKRFTNRGPRPKKFGKPWSSVVWMYNVQRNKNNFLNADGRQFFWNLCISLHKP